MYSRAAISALDSPCPTATATARSRSVSRSSSRAARWARSSAALRVATAITCSMTLGDRVVSPASTARIASTIFDGGVSLSRNPDAPACNARSTRSSESKVVSTMIFGASGRARISAVAASPSITGIRMSISTTSGRSSPTRVIPSAPSDASPITCRSAAPPRISPNPVRTSGSSSTTTSRIRSASMSRPSVSVTASIGRSRRPR